MIFLCIDPLLQTLTPLYYILKVFIFSLIYLSPLKYGIILKDKVMKKINMIGVTVENFFSKKNKSYFENTQNKETLSTKTVNNSMSDSPTFQISEDKASINDSRSKISIYDSTNNSSELLKKNNKNVLSSNEISESILYAHPGDIAFSVDKFLSFPKNFITEVSECVYIKNLNTSNPMVFNIKTNAPNCVNAIPGKAIINNGETLVINILLRPMSEGFKIHKIIIVIEYNIAPIGTKTFSSNLIDGRYKKIFKLCHY
ncbi:MSP domain and PapD-like domain-containing protein [Strongyloides ratti]|uniref:Major sperm protein n=1 Tax=Strongyloides ratti TaxID=34506 RepID=A0A090KZV8_STRRB|nr:MSP domain and PapD-like domain-containing protein [Strongyloides ratti]CEF62966.1 MSP domain and PapD-like domain-containing protein [Strongyloides ratti]